MASSESPLIVVGIGASAGGLESLKEFFGSIRPNNGLAFIVIQHLAPSRDSYMAEILRSHTRMRVVEAKNNLTIEPNSVYTIPPNQFLKIEHGRLRVTDPQTSDGIRMPIDFFFRSLAESQHERAICILFSGSGSDGTLGLREVRAAGGLTIVQKPETAQFDAMLRSAIATGMVDLILPLSEIAEIVQRYVPQIRSDTVNEEREKFEQLDSILDILTLHGGSDFSAYKKSTLLRRIERRMGLNHLTKLARVHAMAVKQSHGSRGAGERHVDRRQQLLSRRGSVRGIAARGDQAAGSRSSPAQFYSRLDSGLFDR
jgi:two-component system, chemotaxis family, CheB/CheR fusion protein